MITENVFRAKNVSIVDVDGNTIATNNRFPVDATINLDNASGDAFGRLRVSNPETIFDSKNIFDNPDLAANVENQPFHYDNQQVSGSGTATAYNLDQASQTLSVSANTAGRRVRQTKRRFNYQPGKSLQVIMSFIFGTQSTGVVRREGYFDDNNGLFLEDTGSVYRLVRRTKATGTVVNNVVNQADWNIDTLDGNGASGIKLDFTKTQLLYMDIEWLGVGRVRMGFIVDGVIYIAHHFHHANVLSTVYMSTPNLPLRAEIENTGTGAAATMAQICSTVISEGAQHPTGEIRRVSTSGTHLDANTENTLYELVSIRLRSGYLGMTVMIEKVSLQLQTASHKVEYVIVFNPTIAGDPTYTGLDRSAIEYHLGATANTVTGGYQISGGWAESGSPAQGSSGSDKEDIKNALLLGSTIAGASDVIALCVRPVGGSSNVDVEGSITWRELS